MHRLATRKNLLAVYQALLDMYGEQDWWPADSPFEVMVGAILTQNTAWSNVERAIARLKTQDCLKPERIVGIASAILEDCLKPAGYYRIKAQRLRHFCSWYLAQGGYDALQHWPTDPLRSDLLSVHGIGPETADDILLYAFGRPVFVIDAYTRRLAQRLRWTAVNVSYNQLQQLFEARLSQDVQLYNHYHALIVMHAKTRCRKQKPLCESCLLQSACPHARDRPSC